MALFHNPLYVVLYQPSQEDHLAFTIFTLDFSQGHWDTIRNLAPKVYTLCTGTCKSSCTLAGNCQRWRHLVAKIVKDGAIQWPKLSKMAPSSGQNCQRWRQLVAKIVNDGAIQWPKLLKMAQEQQDAKTSIFHHHHVCLGNNSTEIEPNSGYFILHRIKYLTLSSRKLII